MCWYDCYFNVGSPCLHLVITKAVLPSSFVTMHLMSFQILYIWQKDKTEIKKYHSLLNDKLRLISLQNNAILQKRFSFKICTFTHMYYLDTHNPLSWHFVFLRDDPSSWFGQFICFKKHLQSRHILNWVAYTAQVNLTK